MWVHLPILPILQRTLDAGPLGDLAFLGSAHDGLPFSKAKGWATLSMMLAALPTWWESRLTG